MVRSSLVRDEYSFLTSFPEEVSEECSLCVTMLAADNKCRLFVPYGVDDDTGLITATNSSFKSVGESSPSSHLIALPPSSLPLELLDE